MTGLPGMRHAAPPRRSNDMVRELVRFCVVGASGYGVNLAAYGVLLSTGLPYLAAAAGSFAVAVANNYSWNRLWTFRGRCGDVRDQGLRFLVVSLGSLAANLALLNALVGLHADKLVAQATAIVLVTPLNFLGSRLWAFARPHPATAG